MKADTLDILFQDNFLLAINKPSGLLSLPDGYDPTLPHLRALLETQHGPLWILHRLDRDTSGVILLARDAHTHRAMNGQFEKHRVMKTYHALVQGSPGWDEKDVTLRLRPNGDRSHRTLVDARSGKTAATHFRTLQVLGDYCLLQATPLTGRTHQIRAHLAALNLPILGDTLYGGKPALYLSMLKPGFSYGIKGECALIQRTALHAYSLMFTHPHSGEPIHLEAPYPKDFNAALRMLQRYGG